MAVMLSASEIGDFATCPRLWWIHIKNEPAINHPERQKRLQKTILESELKKADRMFTIGLFLISSSLIFLIVLALYRMLAAEENLIPEYIAGIVSAIVATGSVIFSIGIHNQHKYGIMSGKRIYSGSTHAGFPLYAFSVPLTGVPDIVTERRGAMVPILKKHDETPTYPPQADILELMALCLLIEEHYGKTPPGGDIAYPEKTFRIAYSQEGKQEVLARIKEITTIKEQGIEPSCKHPEHNSK